MFNTPSSGSKLFTVAFTVAICSLKDICSVNIKISFSNQLGAVASKSINSEFGVNKSDVIVSS